MENKGVNGFIAIIEDEFTEIEKESLKPNDNFKNMIEWNSFNTMLLLMIIESYYKVKLQRKDLTGVKTVKELFEKIQINSRPLKKNTQSNTWL